MLHYAHNICNACIRMYFITHACLWINLPSWAPLSLYSHTLTLRPISSMCVSVGACVCLREYLCLHAVCGWVMGILRCVFAHVVHKHTNTPTGAEAKRISIIGSGIIVVHNVDGIVRSERAPARHAACPQRALWSLNGYSSRNTFLMTSFFYEAPPHVNIAPSAMWNATPRVSRRFHRIAHSYDIRVV